MAINYIPNDPRAGSVNKSPQLNRMKGKISHGYQLHSKRPACWFDGPADP